MMLTANDLEILDSTAPDTLIRWFHLLNEWKWPAELPDPEPTIYIKGGRRGELLRTIEATVGLKAILRDWNCSIDRGRMGMSEAEFEDFWAGIFEGNAAAADRHHLRDRKLCRTSFKILRRYAKSKEDRYGNRARAQENIREMRTTGELVKG